MKPSGLGLLFVDNFLVTKAIPYIFQIMCILLLLGVVLYKYQGDQVTRKCCSDLLHSCLLRGEGILMLTITERGMLKFPTLIIAFSVLPFSSVSFYFMYSEALLLDGCTFGIVMPSQ